MKNGFLVILIFTAIPSFSFFENKLSRSPAAMEEIYSVPAPNNTDMMSSVKTACEKITDGSPGYEMCRPYLNAKRDLDKTGREALKYVNDYVPEELMGVTGVLVQSLYEGRVKIGFKTGYGNPDVSISDRETLLKWNWRCEF